MPLDARKIRLLFGMRLLRRCAENTRERRRVGSISDGLVEKSRSWSLPSARVYCLIIIVFLLGSALFTVRIVLMDGIGNNVVYGVLALWNVGHLKLKNQSYRN